MRVRLGPVARPHAGAQAVQRVVGDGERFVGGLERGHRDDRAEDLLLEHAHLVVTGQDRRLDVEPVLDLAVEHRSAMTRRSSRRAGSPASRPPITWRC